MTALLGNLLDNALEACDKMEPQDRWIQIVIRQMGNASFIKVSNTCAQKPERIGEEFVSGKQGTLHGIGTKSIREIVERYGGVQETGYKEGIFFMTISFF
ncbi:MAG: ATP-binding protein [Lachnospiraceae bacterium]